MRELPRLDGRRSPPSRPLRLLAGGYSNRTLLLAGARTDYVLRLGECPPPLGVDREREYRIAVAAAQRDLGPAICFCDPGRGILVTEYVGEALTNGVDAGQLAALLRRIHDIPASGAALDSASRLQEYRDLLPDGRTTAALDNLQDLLTACPPLIAAPGSHPVTCHNDLLTPNLRGTPTGLLAIDWEYASSGDRFYDIAVCTARWQHPAALRLVQRYLGRVPSAAENAALAAQRLLYAGIACCWYALHGGPRDIDQYAAEQLQLRSAELSRILAT